MKVQSIKQAIRGMSGPEIVASAAQAVEELYNDHQYSRVFAGLIFPEVWSDVHGGSVDYSPWFELREDLATRHGIRGEVRRLEYPLAPHMW